MRRHRGNRLGGNLVNDPRYFWPVMLLLAFMAFMPRVHAQTQTQNGAVWRVNDTPESQASTGLAACQAWYNWQASIGYGTGWSVRASGGSESSGTVSCQIHSGEYVNQTITATRISESSASCPGGSVVSGASCTCPANTAWNGQTCSGAAPGAGTCASVEGMVVTVLGSTAPDVQTVCSEAPGESMAGKKCNAHVRGGVCLGGGRYCTTEVRLLATECTGTIATTNAQPSPCAAGQHPVELNGQTLCVGAGGAGTTPSRVQRTESVAADGTRQVTIRNVNCSGVDCNYTETRQSYDTGGAAVGNPETTTGSQRGLYGEQAGGGGSASDLSTGPGPNLGTRSVGLDAITPVSGFSTGSCPADIPLPRGMSFSWAPICTTANTLRPLIIALAWLSALLIVVGGMRKG
jgi:hypothetical protein